MEIHHDDGVDGDGWMKEMKDGWRRWIEGMDGDRWS